MCVFFCFKDTATTEIYTLSLHDALPICVKLDRLLDDLQLSFRKVEFEGDFFGGGRPVELVLKFRSGPTPLREEFDHVRRYANGFRRIDQCAFDRLLNPVTGIRAEPQIGRASCRERV